MVEGPYEILPYAEIDKLKKDIEGMKKKTASSEEILDAINRLAKTMESMLHLFENAAAEMRTEGEDSPGKKLDVLIDQNETIAEGLLGLVDMIKDIQPREKEVPEMKEVPQPPLPEPMPKMGRQGFSPFGQSRPMPPGQQAMRPSHFPPPPDASMPKEGPRPMPTGSFKDLDLNDIPEPKGFPGQPPEKPKKGLFRK